MAQNDPTVKICPVNSLKPYIIKFLRKKLNVSNIIQHTSISLHLETFENLNGLVMEESVYSGDDTKF